MSPSKSIQTWIIFLCLFGFGLSLASAVQGYAGHVGKERIVFCATKNPGGQSDIITLDPDGSDPINLTSDFGMDAYYPVISPDGRRIVFISGSSDLWWMYSDGSNKTQITSGMSVNNLQWYDNDTVLYGHWYGNSTGDIRSVDIDGSNDALLIDKPNPSNPQISNFAYSRVTHMLVFVAQVGSWAPTHDLYITEVLSPSTHGPVYDFYLDPNDDHDDSYPVFSPDGQIVYWTHCMLASVFPNNPAIVCKAVDSPNSGYDDLIRDATGNRVATLACSPDGNYLLFNEPGQLFAFDLTQGQDIALYSAQYMGFGDWGYLNMLRILFTAEEYTGATSEIYSMNPDGSGMISLTADFDGDAWYPVISPDGTKIVFLGALGTTDIWCMNSDGSGKTQVTSGKNIGSCPPQWYDDDTILYDHWYGNSTGDIRSIDIDGSNDALLIDQPDPSNPQISNFGYSRETHMLVFVAQVGSSGPTHDLYMTEVLSPSTHGPVYDFYLDPNDDHDDSYPVFSPDGQIVYWVHCMLAGVFPNDPAIVCKAVDSPNSGYDDVIRDATGNRVNLFACSPDGNYLLYSEPGHLFAWDLAMDMEIELHTAPSLSGGDYGCLYHRPGRLIPDSIFIPSGSTDPLTFILNAGPENAGRYYILLAGASGTSPGTALPGGYATLPLNWDLVTDLVLMLLNSPVCPGFLGALDANGVATASLNHAGGLPANLSLYFAYALNNIFDFVSEPVCIQTLP